MRAAIALRWFRQTDVYNSLVPVVATSPCHSQQLWSATLKRRLAGPVVCALAAVCAVFMDSALFAAVGEYDRIMRQQAVLRLRFSAKLARGWLCCRPKHPEACQGRLCDQEASEDPLACTGSHGCGGEGKGTPLRLRCGYCWPRSLEIACKPCLPSLLLASGVSSSSSRFNIEF